MFDFKYSQALPSFLEDYNFYQVYYEALKKEKERQREEREQEEAISQQVVGLGLMCGRRI